MSFKSRFGLACVIDILTGYVIDYIVMSKSCRLCIQAEKYLGSDTSEFALWMEGHEQFCDANHEGFSGSMEMAAAEILRKRSLKYGYRYKIILSNGDAKTIQHLNSIKVYGEDFDIEKEDSVNHVGKR